ncbi:MAG: hypothetical protein AAF799_30745 [Myxococcota bacterium]
MPPDQIRLFEKKVQVSEQVLEDLTVWIRPDGTVSFGVGVIQLNARSSFGNFGASYEVPARTLLDEGLPEGVPKAFAEWWNERLSESERQQVLASIEGHLS